MSDKLIAEVNVPESLYSTWSRQICEDWRRSAMKKRRRALEAVRKELLKKRNGAKSAKMGA